jgi:hypothetical protein
VNFLDAINAHIMWKLRLQRYLEGNSEESLDPGDICKDNQCKLGKWIHGNLDRYEKSPVFVYMCEMHTEFHLTTAEIVQLINDNQKQEAEMLLRGDYSQLSRHLQTHIRTLARDLNLDA